VMSYSVSPVRWCSDLKSLVHFRFEAYQSEIQAGWHWLG
jgi:hypothetical protein